MWTNLRDPFNFLIRNIISPNIGVFHTISKRVSNFPASLYKNYGTKSVLNRLYNISSLVYSGFMFWNLTPNRVLFSTSTTKINTSIKSRSMSSAGSVKIIVLIERFLTVFAKLFLISMWIHCCHKLNFLLYNLEFLEENLILVWKISVIS